MSLSPSSCSAYNGMMGNVSLEAFVDTYLRRILLCIPSLTLNVTAVFEDAYLAVSGQNRCNSSLPSFNRTNAVE